MLEYAIASILNKVCTPVIGKDRVSPIFTTKSPGVTYTDTPISAGAINEDQVEVKIIDDDYDRALELRKAIKEKLNTTINEPSLFDSNVVIRSELSGGGSIFDDSIQIWELSLIFIIKWKVVKK